MNNKVWLIISLIISIYSCLAQSKKEKNPNILCDKHIIFENLSKAQKDSFIIMNRELLNKNVLLYYDNYLKIKNDHIIFSLIYDCRTENEDLIPFYFYVVNQLSEISDGYLGEAIWGYFSDMFFNHPSIIYGYLNKCKNDKNGKYKAMLYNIMFEINGRELNNNVLDSIFNSHKRKCPGCEEIIDSAHSFVLKNKSYK